MKKSQLAVVALLALMMSALVMADASRHRSEVSEPDRRKADYTFLEALRYRADDRNDAYAELLTRAYRLNPDDPTIGFYYGLVEIGLSDGDSADISHGMMLMDRYLATNPSDYSNAITYAGVAQRVGDPDETVRTWRNIHYNNPGRPEFAYHYASILASLADTASVYEAVSVLDSLEVSGKELGLSSRKIQLLYQIDDTAAMLSELDGLLKAPPASVDKVIFAGDVFSALQHTDSARHYYDLACEMDSTSGTAYYSRAEFYRSIGDSVGYDREIFNALNSNSLDLDVKTELMRTYVSNLISDSTQHDRLDSLFRHLVSLHPHQATIRALYAAYLISDSRFPEAIEQQTYSLDLQPDDVKGWQTLQFLYVMEDSDAMCVETGKRGLHYFPDDLTLLRATGGIYSQMNMPDSALCYFNKGLKVVGDTDPEERSVLLGSIADVYYGTERVDSAMAYYVKAIDENPENLPVLNNYAYMLAESDKDLDKALAMIQKASSGNPDDVNALDTYAWVLFKLKKYPEARDKINKAMEKAEELSHELLDHAGDIYFMNGDRTEAIEYWKQALELKPDDELLARKVREGTIFFK